MGLLSRRGIARVFSLLRVIHCLLFFVVIFMLVVLSVFSVALGCPRARFGCVLALSNCHLNHKQKLKLPSMHMFPCIIHDTVGRGPLSQ